MSFVILGTWIFVFFFALRSDVVGRWFLLSLGYGKRS